MRQSYDEFLKNMLVLGNYHYNLEIERVKSFLERRTDRLASDGKPVCFSDTVVNIINDMELLKPSKTGRSQKTYSAECAIIYGRPSEAVEKLYIKARENKMPVRLAVQFVDFKESQRRKFEKTMVGKIVSLGKNLFGSFVIKEQYKQSSRHK